VTESLAAALAAFQAELPKLGKGSTATVRSDKGNYSYKYATLADVSLAVLPLLGKHGLSFSAKPTLDDAGRFVLEYALRHTSGEADCGKYPLPTGTPQQVGSAVTYARRYALCAITGLAPDDDDDGKAATDGYEPAQYEPQPPPKQWDPIEQDTLFAGWNAEIEDAPDMDGLAAIGKRLRVAKNSKELSPTSYDKLVQAGAARKAELNGASQ